jgi:hypothetical protein
MVRTESDVNVWLEQVGLLTATHRAAKAERFARMARRRLFQRRLEGYSDTYAREDGRWYRARERGQHERPQRVAACGTESLLTACVGCGQVHECRSGCRVGLLCVPCRGALAAAKRSTFARARRVSIADAARRGLLNPSRRGGRWSEKFLTLTAPHWRSDSIPERIGHVVRAWVRFLRKLNDFWKQRDVRSAEWLRVFEWTPGDDERGHPHLHIWILSPFLPRDELERWWREALAEQTGCASVERVIIDIREVHDEGAERELIKYLTKDITANGEKLAPELYAQVYKALDGLRTTQASRGFMGRAAQEERRCDCGCALPKRVRRVPTEGHKLAKEESP